MSEKLAEMDNSPDVTATLTFLKQTKEGIFTEVKPIEVSISRAVDMRELNYAEIACCFSYTD